MRKKTLLIIIPAALIVLAGMTLDFGFPVEKVIGYGFLSQDYRDRQIREKYRSNFSLAKTPVGNITCYIPSYVEVSEETVRRYTTIFKTTQLESNDDSEDSGMFIYFSGSSGRLRIYRYVDGFIYDGFASDGTDGSLLKDGKSAIATALKYFENRYLPIGYEETKVRFDDGVYSIVFIKRLGNIKNYAYNNSVQLDEYGNMLQMSYHNIDYEPYQTCRIISMKESYRSLPLDLTALLSPSPVGYSMEADAFSSDGDKLDKDDLTVCRLNSCELVYVFENSILQPAYYYEGEITDGSTTKIFECFVKAADYDNR